MLSDLIEEAPQETEDVSENLLNHSCATGWQYKLLHLPSPKGREKRITEIKKSSFVFIILFN